MLCILRSPTQMQCHYSNVSEECVTTQSKLSSKAYVKHSENTVNSVVFLKLHLVRLENKLNRFEQVLGGINAKYGNGPFEFLAFISLYSHLNLIRVILIRHL